MIKLVLAALTLTILAGTVVIERRYPSGEPAREAPNSGSWYDAHPVSSPAIALGTANTVASGELATVLARPVFEPTRRPIAPPTATGASRERLPRLSGILVTSAARLVIFAATKDGKSVTAKEGTKIGSYLVEAIAPGGVTVRGPDGMQTIKPYYDPDEGAPAVAALPSLVVRAPTSAVQSSVRQGATLQTIVRPPPGRAPRNLPIRSEPADSVDDVNTMSESPS